MTVEAEERVHRVNCCSAGQLNVYVLNMQLARVDAHLHLLSCQAVYVELGEFSVGIIHGAVERLLQVSLLEQCDVAYFSELGVAAWAHVALE